MHDTCQKWCATALWPLLLCGLAGCSGVSASGAPETDVEQRVANPAEHRLDLTPRGPGQAGPSRGGSVRWFTGHVFVLHNQGEHSFPYVLQGSVEWLRVAGPANGVLGAGKRLTIELSIEQKLAPEEAGQHTAHLWVLNAVTFHREFSIDVTWLVPVGGERTRN